MAPGPKVLLLDEPLSALDLKLRQEMRVELKQLQQETGITFVFVTHDQEEALTMSDRIAVMSEGEVQQIGSAHDIYDQPANRFVADFIGETNLIDVTVEAVEGRSGTCRLPGGATVTADAGSRIVAGIQCTLSIRPERITVSTERDDGSLTGTVEHMVYLGTDTQHIVALSDGAKITTRTQNAHMAAVDAQTRRHGFASHRRRRRAPAGGLMAAVTGGRAVSGTYRPMRNCLLAPSWLVIGFFLLLPVLIMLVYSFLTKEFRGGVIWEFSLAAYDQFLFDRGLFGDDPPTIEWTYITIYIRSILQALAATVVCLIIGFPTAFFIATRPPETRTIWLFLVTVPYWVNLLIRTVSMKFLIRDNGPLNEGLLGLGVITEPLTLINTDFAVQLGLFYSYLPFMVLPIYASVERYNFALSEAAADLYADRWTILRRVVLPVVSPGIIAGCILVFVPSLGAFLAPDLLGGAKNWMIGSLIEDQFKGAAGNWPFGAAASMILLSMVLLVLIFYARRQSRAEDA